MKGTFQTSSDSIGLGESQTRPRDSQMGNKGTYQEAGADYCPTNESEISPPYSNEGPKGEFQMGGADKVDLKTGGRNFAFSEQGSGSSVRSTGKI